MSVAKQIIDEHLVEGSLRHGNEIALRIDQTLMQDATGTMACLQFETLKLPKVRTELSVSYVDHNITETGKENNDFLESFAKKYGIIFSKPGNGICHQLHLENFAMPGKTLLGSDSHTPTAGGISSLAIGAGGLDIAAAMAGYPFYLAMPEIVGIELKGKLGEWVSAKDIILFVLKKLTVKGGVGRIIEYFGSGVKNLTVPERATITNMGAELGATTSIFPSDSSTRQFLISQEREKDWKELKPDEKDYDSIIEINLDEIEPLIAMPSSPDNVVEVKKIDGIKVEQVIIGSCTNSSYKDLALVAMILRRNKPKAELSINPGSINVVRNLERGGLFDSIKNSARICDAACLGCIGMGQEPKPNSVSLRTFNRNFSGRSGTENDKVYLCSVETAVASAVKGSITDPRKLGKYPKIELPAKFDTDKKIFAMPSNNPEKIKLVRGKSIKPVPTKWPLAQTLSGNILIKVGDNITTDHIMPAGSKILPLRSNIPAISDYVFHGIDKGFSKRAKASRGGFIVGGENYGQGSSREHAALAPMYLGIKAVIAKSFARIHKSNLINFGILPLEFADKEDYNKIMQGETIEINNTISSLKQNKDLLITNKSIGLKYSLTDREAGIIIAGGKLNFMKNSVK